MIGKTLPPDLAVGDVIFTGVTGRPLAPIAAIEVLAGGQRIFTLADRSQVWADDAVAIPAQLAMPDAEAVEPELCAADCGRPAAGWPAGPTAEDGELCEDCHDAGMYRS